MRTHVEKKSILLSLGLAWFLAGCGSTNFVSQANEKDDSPSSSNHEKADGENFVEEEEAEIPYGKCPTRPQNILVLDFKSGWWAGDGGNFFNKILHELTIACESTIKIEYHHITVAGIDLPPISKVTVKNTMMVFPKFDGEKKMSKEFEKGFLETDWRKYTQIWLLSGSRFDPADIKPNNKFFASVLNGIRTSGANLFIGSGYGSITHSNALMEKLGMKSKFATKLPEGRLLNPTASISELTQLTVGSELQDFHLFTDLGEISDNMEIDGVEAKGDYLVAANDIKVVGVNTEGKDSIAVGNVNEQRIVLDAGLQRYYSIFKDISPGTMMLIHNVISYLSI